MRDFSKFKDRFVGNELETLEIFLLQISQRNLLLQNKMIIDIYDNEHSFVDQEKVCMHM